MSAYYTMMTPEELVEEMLKLEIGERIDVPADIDTSYANASPFGNTEYGEGGCDWYGIIRIDASMFSEEYAWLCDYYGGECAEIIAVSDADMSCREIGKEYVVNQLNEWLKKWGILQMNGKVAVEVELPKPKVKVRKEKED